LYFDDLGKSDISLSKNYVTNKIWGTETTYDDFGRPDKTSFVAPSPLSTFEKTNFLKSNAEVITGSYPPILSLNNIAANNTYKATQSITVTGTVASGLNVNLTAPVITLSNTFSITATSGSSFVLTAAYLQDVSANPSLANYYSDNNTDEPYQATATHPFAQNNYDSLNPGNIINVVGGNKINGEWKTGYTYTVPAAQEMYYVYGSDYYDGTISNGKEEVITKFYKSVSTDANGNENVAFADGEGKLLATARSGGSTTYPVVSLIGTQGFVDVHIPAGITSGISLIGGAGLYKIYDLKTGLITSGLTSGNAYRVEAITPPASDPKTYISGGQPTYDPGSLGITYSVNYYDYTVNIYNKTGQLVKTIQPNGYSNNTTVVASPSHMTSANFATTYVYNALGQLTATTSPDQGTSKFAYRKDGQIRYSQSALQTDTKVSYTDYDDLGRPKESGVIANNWTTANVNPDGALISGTRTEQTCTIYDDTENNLTSIAIPTNLNLNSVLATAGINSANYTQNNLSGNVAVTFTKPETTITAITWYSYDLYGRTEWIVQYNEGLGAKTIHYEYNYKGDVKKVLFQKDKIAELFAHQYTYNSNNALIKVQTSTDNTNFTTNADYSYYQTGELKRINIAQGTQGIDYVYTLGGQLKSINHPSLEASKDPCVL
jgi:YD repeat-containing protein